MAELALFERDLGQLGSRLIDQGQIAGTFRFVHKSDRVHVQSVDAQVFAAAQRLQARGSAPVDSFIRKVIKRAADSVGLKPLRFGELRHSFVTWAAERRAERAIAANAFWVGTGLAAQLKRGG